MGDPCESVLARASDTGGVHRLGDGVLTCGWFSGSNRFLSYGDLLYLPTDCSVGRWELMTRIRDWVSCAGPHLWWNTLRFKS